MIDTKVSNYNKIVNFLYEDNSVVSIIIISYYQDYLSMKRSRKSKEKVDLILNEYIKKNEFYKYVQKYFNIDKNNNLFKNFEEVLNKLNELYIAYCEVKYKRVRNTRWL